MWAVLLFLSAVAIGLLWWVLHRSARLRRESENREARVLEAIFAARGTASGAAGIDIDRVLGSEPSPAGSANGDAVMRAAALAASIAAPVATRAFPQTPPAAAAPLIDANSAADGVAVMVGSAADSRTDPAGEPPARVRDLVQVFYEARGFRSTSLEASARPVELVLAHKSDPQRSYAFVPMAAVPSGEELNSIAAAARRVGQLRVLVATETSLPANAADSPVGVRVYDRAAIDSQLARIDAAIAARIRAAAQRRRAIHGLTA
jgi:hypothetical protein